VEVSQGKEAEVETHESRLQPDGSTFPPVTPDVPEPPGVEVPQVPDLVPESPSGKAEEFA
jgi:hypothetical protein